MPVIMVEEGLEFLRALVGVRVRVSVGPFIEGSLNKALGLAVCFWGVGLSEAVFEPQAGDGGAHVF